MSNNGRRLGGYRIARTLGIGASGQVRLAYHELTKHRVAVKLLDKQILKQKGMDSKVRTEISVLSKVSHPNIIELYEVIETPMSIAIFMEYVPRGELFEFIVEQARISEKKARQLFGQLISAVECLHESGVVHRDLKPENLLLDEKYRIKLADFGFSNYLLDGKFLSTSCGSPNYAAPELLEGALYSGPEVDVWSCGVILYTMLCKKLPFDDPHDNFGRLFRLIKGGIYTIPSHVSKDARDLIQRMLTVDPLQRIKTNDIRKHPWFRKSKEKEFRFAVNAGIDDVIAADVIAKGKNEKEWTMDRLKIALSYDSALLTDNKYAKYPIERAMAVSYRLLMTDKRKRQQDIFALQSSLSFQTEAETKQTIKEARIKEAQNKVARAGCLSGCLQPGDPLNGARLSQGWQIGQWFHGYSAGRIMNVLLHILRDFMFEWKHISPYHIKARTLLSMASPSTDFIPLFGAGPTDPYGGYSPSSGTRTSDVTPTPITRILSPDFTTESNDSTSDEKGDGSRISSGLGHVLGVVGSGSKQRRTVFLTSKTGGLLSPRRSNDDDFSRSQLYNLNLGKQGGVSPSTTNSGRVNNARIADTGLEVNPTSYGSHGRSSFAESEEAIRIDDESRADSDIIDEKAVSSPDANRDPITTSVEEDIDPDRNIVQVSIRLYSQPSQRKSSRSRRRSREKKDTSTKAQAFLMDITCLYGDHFLFFNFTSQLLHAMSCQLYE